MMILESLNISKCDFSYDGRIAGHYYGTIKFSGTGGKVEIALKPEHVQPILEIVAAGLVAAAKEVAAVTCAQIIQGSVPASEGSV